MDPASARAREEAMQLWITAIANGASQRGAAAPLLASHGRSYKALLSIAQEDPEGWGAALEAAQAAKIARYERVLDRIAMNEPGDVSEDPGSVNVKLSAVKFLLEKLDRATYGQKLDQTVSGPDGGAVQSEVRITIAEARELAKDDE
jgi:hypothetical protein